MVTSRKTARKATTPASTPTAKAGGAGFGELGRLLGRFKLPEVDVAAIVESSRKDMEALADANRQAYEGIRALAARRNEMIQEALVEWRESMQQIGSKAAIEKQAGLARKSVQKALADWRELAEIEAKTRKQAWKLVQERFEENLAGLRKLLQPPKP